MKILQCKYYWSQVGCITQYCNRCSAAACFVSTFPNISHTLIPVSTFFFATVCSHLRGLQFSIQYTERCFAIQRVPPFSKQQIFFDSKSIAHRPPTFSSIIHCTKLTEKYANKCVVPSAHWGDPFVSTAIVAMHRRAKMSNLNFPPQPFEWKSNGRKVSLFFGPQGRTSFLTPVDFFLFISIQLFF